jgi:hypothetical protein
MTDKYVWGTLQFIGLILAQVLVFNHLNILGSINPMIYILFFYWYPIQENRTVLIGLAFLLGFGVDLFSDTMALHTAASLTTAFFRYPIMRFVFGVNMEFQNFRIGNSTRVQQYSFLALLIVIHHLTFFGLEIFSLPNLLLILKRILFTGVSTFVFGALLIALFSGRKE